MVKDQVRQILYLVDEDNKLTIINMVHIFKKVEESIHIIKTDMEDIKMTHIELLEMKSTISELKNILAGINSRLGTKRKY